MKWYNDPNITNRVYAVVIGLCMGLIAIGLSASYSTEHFNPAFWVIAFAACSGLSLLWAAIPYSRTVHMWVGSLSVVTTASRIIAIFANGYLSHFTTSAKTLVGFGVWIMVTFMLQKFWSSMSDFVHDEAERREGLVREPDKE